MNAKAITGILSCHGGSRELPVPPMRAPASGHYQVRVDGLVIPGPPLDEHEVEERFRPFLGSGKTIEVADTRANNFVPLVEFLDALHAPEVPPQR